MGTGEWCFLGTLYSQTGFSAFAFSEEEELGSYVSEDGGV